MFGDGYIFFAAVFGFVAVLVWWIARLLLRDDDEKLMQRLRSPNSPADPTESGGGLGAMLTRIGNAASKPFMPTNRERQSALRRQLGYAGIYSPAAIRTLAGCKVLLLAGGLLTGYMLGMTIGNLALGLSVGGLLGYVLPGIWLGRRIKRQQKAIEFGLPDALDLLVVCVEAGLTVDAAMQRVGQELALAHPQLARELEITHMETRVGVARADAMKNLAARTGSTSLNTLATMLIQAERFGTSLAQSLRIQAETLRVARQHKAEEMAAKASVKLSFPVVLFIFPAVLIVLAGPAAIGLLKSALFAD